MSMPVTTVRAGAARIEKDTSCAVSDSIAADGFLRGVPYTVYKSTCADDSRNRRCN